MLKKGADGREVAKVLEPLAYDNNAHAQLLLGGLYVEGKTMPRDAVEGFAWVHVASTSLDAPVASLAKKMLAGEAALSGEDLIRADQRAIAIQAAITARQYEKFGDGVRVFTSERPVSFQPIKFGVEVVQLAGAGESRSNPYFRLGCAALVDPRCPANSQALAGPRCAGRIAQAETGPSAMPSAQTHLVQPEFPTELRRGRRFSGTTIVVVHVDRSGWICGAAVARSSGEPLWDDAALAAVTLWRLQPAMLRGEAVEGLHMFAVSANSH